MNKKKARMLYLRAGMVFCGLIWFIGFFMLIGRNTLAMNFFIIAQVGGAVVAYKLTKDPGAAVVSFLFPMIMGFYLAFKKLFVEYPLTRKQRSEALRKAYWENDIGEAEWLLQKPVDLAQKTYDGEIYLTHSYREGRFPMFKILLKGGADPNLPDAKGWTPLMLACHKGDLEITRLLLERGADVNAQNKDSWTPLMLACEKGHLETIRLLIDKRAQIDARNANQATPLYIAAANGRSEMVERLLALGAEIDHPDLKGETPVQAALRNHHLPTVDLLLKNGAAVDAAFLEKVAAAKAKPEKIEVVSPVFDWRGDDFAGGNMTDVELLRAESNAAISWFATQKFVPIPTLLGEKGAADYCFDMATIAQNSGILKEAWAGFHLALRRYAKMGDDRMTGLTCFNLGKVYGAQSHWKMAQMMFQHSASVTSRIGEEKGLAWALFYLGDTRQKRGDKSECRYYWLLAQKIFDRVSPGDAKNVETALTNL